MAHLFRQPSWWVYDSNFLLVEIRLIKYSIVDGVYTGDVNGGYKFRYGSVDELTMIDRINATISLVNGGRGISTSINVYIIDSDSIVYGRYNELVNGCEWVCKPTNTTGGVSSCAQDLRF